MPSAVRLLLLALALVALTPASALAEWRRAESAHFVVYSDGSERSLREYTAKLERFDALMRLRFGGWLTGRSTMAARLWCRAGPPARASR
jgi:hypothetical protein